MKFEVRFPKGFPEVGDVVKFTCRNQRKVGKGVTAEQITGQKISSTVEVLVIGRSFDEATELHYLVTADDCFKHICKHSDGWESEGWTLIMSEVPEEASQRGMRFEECRANIHQLKVVRKHR